MNENENDSFPFLGSYSKFEIYQKYTSSWITYDLRAAWMRKFYIEFFISVDKPTRESEMKNVL